MGEDADIRRTMTEMRKRLRDSGYRAAAAEKTARECAIRADRRKREGGG